LWVKGNVLRTPLYIRSQSGPQGFSFIPIAVLGFHSVASIACGVHGVRSVDLVWAGGSTAESRNRQGFHFRNPKTCPNNPDTSLHYGFSASTYTLSESLSWRSSGSGAWIFVSPACMISALTKPCASNRRHREAPSYIH